ncbi:hypothetical protein BDP27DRAFT_668656 [Rhodocollybia butyracea]|uniref:Uncharacterized protein n=1 Tax=Rhodocollybia butyracea TaxID=206335 RepID=A0A9P5P3X6_9AGAR|nr:hypothetical protein BDP27DRAFT_668656 [Rhodocollybia butyracea]
MRNSQGGTCSGWKTAFLWMAAWKGHAVGGFLRRLGGLNLREPLRHSIPSASFKLLGIPRYRFCFFVSCYRSSILHRLHPPNLRPSRHPHLFSSKYCANAISLSEIIQRCLFLSAFQHASHHRPTALVVTRTTVRRSPQSYSSSLPVLPDVAIAHSILVSTNKAIPGC